jgi:hypothetical protein
MVVIEFIIGLVIQLIVSTGLIWVIVNYLLKGPEHESIGRCFTAAVAMLVITILAVLCLMFPFPILNIVAAIFVYFWGNKTAIEAVFERWEGGWFILFAYLACSWAINHALGSLSL